MKFVFVCVHIQRSSRAIPLGAASVAANVKKHFPTEIDIEIVDCYLNDSLEIHIEKIAEHNPDSLGLSIYLWNRKTSLEIASSIKSSFPACNIMVGGSEPSARPDFYKENPDIDFVFEGESEDLIIPVIRQLLNKSAASPPPPPPTLTQILGHGSPDLEKLPSPYLDGTLPLDNYTGVLW
ncbi:MAG: cobalamin B12-binding domain-containing protein [Bacteroidetes bacterium]|nr:cobalamin B12-binding domain-containing protein [Bacteroidota bacterium]